MQTKFDATSRLDGKIFGSEKIIIDGQFEGEIMLKDSLKISQNAPKTLPFCPPEFVVVSPLAEASGHHKPPNNNFQNRFVFRCKTIHVKIH